MGWLKADPGYVKSDKPYSVIVELDEDRVYSKHFLEDYEDGFWHITAKSKAQDFAGTIRREGSVIKFGDIEHHYPVHRVKRVKVVPYSE